MAKQGLKPGDAGYEGAVRNAARALYDHFGFQNPGPSPIDYPDEVRAILHENGLARIAFGNWQKPVSRVHRYDVVAQIIPLVDSFKAEFDEENYIRWEREGKQGIEDPRLAESGLLD